MPHLQKDIKNKSAENRKNRWAPTVRSVKWRDCSPKEAANYWIGETDLPLIACCQVVIDYYSVNLLEVLLVLPSLCHRQSVEERSRLLYSLWLCGTRHQSLPEASFGHFWFELALTPSRLHKWGKCPLQCWCQFQHMPLNGLANDWGLHLMFYKMGSPLFRDERYSLETVTAG